MTRAMIYCLISIFYLHIQAQNVGIGTTMPSQLLDVGGKIQIGDDGNASEAGAVRYNAISDVLEFYDGTIWHSTRSPWMLTAGNLHYDDGNVLIGRTSTIGAEHFGIRASVSGAEYGGMYMETNGSATSRPFYGYAIDNGAKAWHYFDGSSLTWRLNNNGDWLVVANTGDVGIGVTDPQARLDILGGDWNLEAGNSGDLRIGNPTYNFRIGVATAGGDAGTTRLFSQGGSLLLGTQNTAHLIINTSGQIGAGDSPVSGTTFKVTSTSEPTSIEVISNYNGALAKTGVSTLIISGGTGPRTGVSGIAFGTVGLNTNTIGVYGEANKNNTTGLAYGVYGAAQGAGSMPGYGVYGVADSGYGVYGKSIGGNARAGFFEGEVVIGKGAGSDSAFTFLPTGYSSGSLFEMFDHAGVKTIEIRANGDGTSQGSDLLMYSDDGMLSLQIDADVAGNGSGTIEIHTGDGTKTVELDAAETSGQGAALKLGNSTGEVTIELDADFAGNGRVITQEFEITGGSDIAEYFNIKPGNTMAEPGLVVSVHSEGTGTLMITKEARDRKVAGVISGANGVKPGMMMGQKGTIAYGDLPVAVTGRVFVRSTQENGQILPGDFLTSASVPGHAMRVKKLRKARGAIIGKALTYADENGFVLMLVQLH